MSKKGITRAGLALVLTSGLALVALAPVWHHEHVELPEPSQCSHKSRDAGARLHDATGPVVFLADTCPICLSQRLLGQSLLALAAQAPSPVPSPDGIVDTGARAAVHRAFAAEARGPPLSGSI